MVEWYKDILKTAVPAQGDPIFVGENIARTWIYDGEDAKESIEAILKRWSVEEGFLKLIETIKQYLQDSFENFRDTFGYLLSPVSPSRSAKVIEALKKKERDESEDTDSEVESLEEIDAEHGYGDIYPKK